MSVDAVLDSAPRRRVTTWLFNPFYYIAGGQALAIGIVAILAGSLCNALTNSHFDGVLEFHTGALTQWWTYWVEGPIDWLVMSGLLLAGGKLLSQSRIRVLDVAGTQALARMPSSSCR